MSSDQPTEGLTNPQRTTRGPMKPRLDTALRSLGVHRNAQSVLAVLDQHELPQSQPCLRYECTATVAWPERGGPPRGFCSDSCRRQYLRERGNLLALFNELTDCLALITTVRARQRIELARANVRWQLLRYPEVAYGAPSESGS